jgi:hypothetical protein
MVLYTIFVEDVSVRAITIARVNVYSLVGTIGSYFRIH